MQQDKRSSNLLQIVTDYPRGWIGSNTSQLNASMSWHLQYGMTIFEESFFQISCSPPHFECIIVSNLYLPPIICLWIWMVPERLKAAIVVSWAACANGSVNGWTTVTWALCGSVGPHKGARWESQWDENISIPKCHDLNGDGLSSNLRTLSIRLDSCF
jgi:hypothetical protein